MRKFNANVTHLVAALAITAAAILMAFAIPAPAQAFTISLSSDDADAIAGSGHEVDIARKVDAFTTLRLDGAANVHARQGATPSVVVHADDNIAPLVETTVEGDTLVVRMRQGTNLRSSHDIVVDVVFTSLAAAHQHGSGNLRIDRLSGQRFESTITGSGDLQIDAAQLGAFALSVAGSGDAAIAGTADEARMGVAGSGDIDASKFAVKRVNISISGAGDARVNATEALEARVAGSGDVRYSGHPREVSRHVAGSGSVEALN